jgi:hypothetical protein
MIKHIVMFKLSEKNPDNLKALTAALNGMKGRIETLRFLEVGEDFKGSDRSFDLVLITHFEDHQGLNIYAEHKVHQPVIQLARSLCSQIVAVDYEINE